MEQVEWEKEFFQRISRIDHQVQRIKTIGLVLSAVPPVLLGLVAWILVSVTGAQTTLAVLDTKQAHASEEIKRVADDIRRMSDEVKRDRETTDKLQAATVRLQTIVERLEKLGMQLPVPLEQPRR